MPEGNGNGNESSLRIQILASIASFLYHEARGLFIAGTGQDELGADVVNVAPEIDTIPADTDGYRWANAVSRFLRYLITVLGPSMQEFYDRRRIDYIDEVIDAALGSGENIDPNIFGDGEI